MPQVGDLITLDTIPDRCAYVVCPARVGVDEQTSDSAPDQYGLPRVVFVRTEHRYPEAVKIVAVDLTLAQISDPGFTPWLAEQVTETRQSWGIPPEVTLIAAYRFEV